MVLNYLSSDTELSVASTLTVVRISIVSQGVLKIDWKVILRVVYHLLSIALTSQLSKS